MSTAWLSPTRCALAVGEPIPFMDSSTSVWLLSSHESFEYFLRFFQRACDVCAFLASSVSHGVVTPPLLPTLTVYYREVPLLSFRLVWCWSGVSVAFARTIPAPILVLALRSAADVAVFSPIPWFSH